MLEYEWGNPSSVMLDAADEDSVQDSDNGRQFFDHFAHNFNDGLFGGVGTFSHHHHHHHHHHPHHQVQLQAQPHFLPFYDPRSAYCGSTSGSGSYQVPLPPPPPPPPPHAAMLSLDAVAAGAGGGYMMVPKSEDMSLQPPAVDFTGRLGLNLGGRTYFSASDEDFVSRLYRRSSSGRPGDGIVGLGNSPRCQAEGCGADLTHAKHYHRRHKVCEYHSKAATVVAAGLTQRFCQQCSRSPFRSYELPKTPSPRTLTCHSLFHRSSILLPSPSWGDDDGQWKKVWLIR